MNYFQEEIYGDIWTFYVVPDDDNVIADEDAAAVTEFDKREVYFRESEIDEVSVRHELFHVYFGYTFTRTADLDHHQCEEVSAELFANRGPVIFETANRVHKKLLEVKNASEDQEIT